MYRSCIAPEKAIVNNLDSSHRSILLGAVLLAALLMLAVPFLAAVSDTGSDDDGIRFAAEPFSASADEADVNGATGYATLALAIQNANDGDTVNLLKDVTLTSAVKIDKNLTVNLGDFTIKTNDSVVPIESYPFKAFLIDSATPDRITVTIRNGTIQDNEFGSYATTQNNALIGLLGEELVLDGITTHSYVGVISVGTGSVMTFNNCVMTSNVPEECPSHDHNCCNIIREYFVDGAAAPPTPGYGVDTDFTVTVTGSFDGNKTFWHCAEKGSVTNTAITFRDATVCAYSIPRVSNIVGTLTVKSSDPALASKFNSFEAREAADLHFLGTDAKVVFVSAGFNDQTIADLTEINMAFSDGMKVSGDLSSAKQVPVSLSGKFITDAGFTFGNVSQVNVGSEQSVSGSDATGFSVVTKEAAEASIRIDPLTETYYLKLSDAIAASNSVVGEPLTYVLLLKDVSVPAIDSDRFFGIMTWTCSITIGTLSIKENVEFNIDTDEYGLHGHVSIGSIKSKDLQNPAEVTFVKRNDKVAVADVSGLSVDHAESGILIGGDLKSTADGAYIRIESGNVQNDKPLTVNESVAFRINNSGNGPNVLIVSTVDIRSPVELINAGQGFGLRIQTTGRLSVVSMTLNPNVALVNDGAITGGIDLNGCVFNGNGTVNGLISHPAAKIGDVYYNTVSEAFAACAAGNEIDVLEDCDIAFTLDKDKTSVVLDLNNHVLTCSSSCIIDSGASLTVIDTGGTSKYLTSGDHEVPLFKNLGTLKFDAPDRYIKGGVLPSAPNEPGPVIENFGVLENNVNIEGSVLFGSGKVTYIGGSFTASGPYIKDSIPGSETQSREVIINGGTFAGGSFQLENTEVTVNSASFFELSVAEFIPEGSYLVYNGINYTALTTAVPSVSIGKVSYMSIEQAFGDANNIGPLNLGEDATLTEDLLIDRDAVFNGNGHTLFGKIVLNGKGTGSYKVEFNDVKFDGSKTVNWAIIGENETTDDIRTVDLTLRNCSFNNYTQKCVYLTNAKNLLVTGCSFNYDFGSAAEYGDYALDLNLIGVRDAVIVIENNTFGGTAANGPVKITQRGDSATTDDAGNGFANNVSSVISSALVSGNTFIDKSVGKGHVIIGSSPSSDMRTYNAAFDLDVVSKGDTVVCYRGAKVQGTEDPFRSSLSDGMRFTAAGTISTGTPQTGTVVVSQFGPVTGTVPACMTLSPVVTFDVCGKGNNTEVTAVYGQPVAAPENPRTSGYKFGGWYTDMQYSTEYDFTSPVKTSLVIYAKWNEVFTVYVDPSSDAGVSIDPVDGACGEVISVNVTVPEGKKIVSLTYSVNYSEPVPIENGSFIMPSGDVAVKLVLADIMLKITVNAGGNGTVTSTGFEVPYGTEASVSGSRLTVGENTVDAVPDERTAQYTYTFLSWTPAMDAPLVIKADTTFTATFVDSVNQYTRTYVMNGHGVQIEPAKADYGKVIAAPAEPSAEGFIFAGWFADPELRSAFDFSAPIAADVSAYASWTPITYTVGFDLQGHGAAIGEQTVAYNGKAIAPEAPAAEGYEFGGWYTDAACKDTWDFSTVVTASMTLYAKWTAVQYTVTAGANVTVEPASAVMGTEVSVKVAVPEHKVLVSVSYAAEGSDPVAISDGRFIMPAADVTVTAVFRDVQYAIEVDDGIIGGTVEPLAYSASMGSEITVDVIADPGYKPVSLFYMMGDKKVIIDGSEFIMPGCDIVVSAVFEVTTDAETETDGEGNVSEESVDRIIADIEAMKERDPESVPQVSIDSSSNEQAVIPSALMDSVKDNGAVISVTTSYGTVSLSSKALSTMDLPAGSKVTMSLQETQVPESHITFAKGCPVFEVTLKVDGEAFSSQFGDLVTVSVPYELRDGEKAGDLVVYHLAEDGTVTKITDVTYEDGVLSFETPHFSTYTVKSENRDPWVLVGILVAIAILTGAVTYAMKRFGSRN